MKILKDYGDSLVLVLPADTAWRPSSTCRLNSGEPTNGDVPVSLDI